MNRSARFVLGSYSKGYSALNLSHIDLDSIDHIEVMVHDAVMDTADAYWHKLPTDVLLDGLVLGTAHDIPVPKTLIDKLNDWMSNHDGTETPGTIEDPDDIDLTISPASFISLTMSPKARLRFAISGPRW